MEAVSPEVVGPLVWRFAHTYAGVEAAEGHMRDFAALLSRTFPCSKCRRNIVENTRALDVNKLGAAAFFSLLHSKVNMKLGKVVGVARVVRPTAPEVAQMCVLLALPLLRADKQTVAGEEWQQRSAFLSACLSAVRGAVRSVSAAGSPYFAPLGAVPSQLQLRAWAVRAVGPQCFEHMMSLGKRCV